MTLSQVTEIIRMPLMPFLFHRLPWKHILLLGLVSWSLRYVMLAHGNSGGLMWLFYGAILLHGICYDFLFPVTLLQREVRVVGRLSESDWTSVRVCRKADFGTTEANSFAFTTSSRY